MMCSRKRQKCFSAWLLLWDALCPVSAHHRHTCNRRQHGWKKENCHDCWHLVYYKWSVCFPADCCGIADWCAELLPGACPWPACRVLWQHCVKEVYRYAYKTEKCFFRPKNARQGNERFFCEIKSENTGKNPVMFLVFVSAILTSNPLGGIPVRVMQASDKETVDQISGANS